MWKSMKSSSSLVDAARPATSVPGANKSNRSPRWRLVRLLADKRRAGKAGKEVPVKLIFCKLEAFPPKNPSGSVSSSRGESSKGGNDIGGEIRRCESAG